MRNEVGVGRIQSVDRAATILEMIGESGSLGVTEIGKALGVHKATASRLAATLAEHGLLERDQGNDRYRLGISLVYLAGAVMAGLDLVSVSRPIVQSLAESTHETVNLGVLHAGAVVCVDQATGRSAVQSVSWIGRRTPLHCTSNGKVLLAGMQPEELQRVLGQPLDALTDRTVVDPVLLRKDLERSKARGYASTIEELEVGLNAVAAPVYRADGQVVAALSVAGPAFRVRPIDLPRFGGDAIEAAMTISRRLGYMRRR